MATFVDSKTRRQLQRSSLYLELEPNDLPRADERRMRNQKQLSKLMVELVDGPPGDPFQNRTEGQELLGHILGDPFELPKLEWIQITGNRYKRHAREDWRTRFLTIDLLRGMARRQFTYIHLRGVDVGLQSLKTFVRDCAVETLALNRVRCEINTHNDNSWCQGYSLNQKISKITFEGCKPVFVEFFIHGIASHRRMHIGLAAADGGKFSRHIWNTIVNASGGLQGIGAITVKNGPVFTGKDTIFADLAESEVDELNLEDARFIVASFQQFIAYVRDNDSYLRRLHIKYWHLVGGFVFDEMRVFMDALEKGPVVWYSHTHISCSIARQLSQKIQDMNLEAVHLEIVRSKGQSFPVDELVRAVRMSKTLGVFNDPVRAREAQKHQVAGLSATGLRYYDIDVITDRSYLDVFTDDQMDLLEQFFDRNRRDAEEERARASRHSNLIQLTQE